MAGSYVDVPGPRMAWDRDCVGIVTAPNATPVTLTAAQRLGLNDESPSPHSLDFAPGATVTILFPQARSLVGCFVSGYQLYVNFSAVGYTLAVSPDTTTGADGTWTNLFTNGLWAQDTLPTYRTGIRTVDTTNVRGVRMISAGGSYQQYLWALHLYGAITADGDRLAFWHPSLDQALDGSAFDFGNVVQGATVSRSFRLKNLSASRTANTITMSVEAPYDRSPSLIPQYATYNTDGTQLALTAGTALTSLAPGALSPVYNLQRTVPANAGVGLGVVRTIATASSWV